VTELPVARLRDDALLPAQAYEGDAGLDLAACERVELGPGERAVVGTGLAVAIPEGYAGFVQPRSGLASRHGISVVNAPGLTDRHDQRPFEDKDGIQTVAPGGELRAGFTIQPEHA